MRSPRKSSRRLERNKLRADQSQKPKFKFSLRLFIFGIAVTFVLLLLYRFLFTPFEFGTLSITAHNNDGSASLLLYDFKEPSITSYVIPAETQVSMAKERGSWRMKSVWKLIEADNLERSVFSDSIMRTFKLPVDDWADETFLNYQDGSFSVTLKSIFAPRSSSLSIRDRIRLALFTRNTRGTNKAVVNLQETGFLSEEVLKDGEEGYSVGVTIPSSIQGNFGEPELTSQPLRVQIKNTDGSRDITTRIVVEIMETLGVNVVAITSDDQLGTGECVVFSKEISVGGQKLAAILNCSYKTEQGIGNYDMVISLTESFMKRF